MSVGIKKAVIDAVKGMKNLVIRVAEDFAKFDKALADRLKKTLKGTCMDVEVSTDWIEPYYLGIDIVCKGVAEFYIEVPVVIKPNVDLISEKDIEVFEED
jgi:hypothetical protein